MVNVFFSYAVKDKEKFQIPKLAEVLEKKSNIDTVYYWEKFSSGSIIEYMNSKVKASDTCVFFYSKMAAASGPVQQERDMAVYQGKHIIPIFTDIDDVPEILQIQTGIDVSEKDYISISNEIYRLIGLKFGFETEIEPTKTDIIIYLSYLTKDADVFKIEEIIDRLKSFNDISEVIYWEEDLDDNVIRFMSDNLGRCDVFILFCSENSFKSNHINKEWTAADMMAKPIIPVFLDHEYIPPLLRSRLGLEINLIDIPNSITHLHSLILKKLEPR